MTDFEREAHEGYTKFRGKCKQMSEEAVAADPTLRLVRGHYFCPFWARNEQHWWTVRADGSIFDPTARQFPSNGSGIYEEFNGIVECSECGQEMPEAEAEFDGNYAFCSSHCHGRFVGVF